MTFRPIVLTATMDPALPFFERHGEPVAIGVTCPRGAVPYGTGWTLTDQRGRAIGVQTTTLDRWGDGSVRWLLAEFGADAVPGGASFYALAPGEGGAPAGPQLTIEHDGELLRVHTGAAVFDVPRFGAGFLADARVAQRSLLTSSAVTAEDDSGCRYAFVTHRTRLERAGELRAVVLLEGRLVEAARVEAGSWLRAAPWLDATVRLTFFAGLGTVTVDVEVTNPRAARHPGGAWDLGDPGSVLIRELAIEVHADAGARPEVWGSLDHGDPMEPSGRRFAVYQDSSGGTNWQHVTHLNRDGRVPVSFRGFKAARDTRFIEGLRAMPIASIGGGDARVSLAMPKFWQLCPKTLEAEGARLSVGMLPRVYGDLHELQGGERTTLTFGLCFGRDTVAAEPLAWMRAPLRVTADPMSYRAAGAWALITSGSSDAVDGYDALVTAAISGPTSFERRREVIDEFGWRNFGELFADHETPQAPMGPDALVSHYNNQYDAIAGFLTRFMHTADHRWLSLANDLALHVADIDLYHTTRDRAAYNGGCFWHTQHYQAAGTATHRAYSRRAGTSGGGPCSEHNYTTGFMLHHFLTGSEKSRAAVIQLANWVIDMDDGRKSRFRWIDRRDTGLASVTRSPDFHGPGRGAGNSINALLDAHRLTAEPRYLAKADALIARCVHPDDDPQAIDPLDAENRWSYTVFLQALGKYLEYRADRGLIDARFDYARAALLEWAQWMSAHERPYLDTPEKLEYPTETWAAQDIRKAAVFEYAARHATDEAVRASFRACAQRFFEYAVRTLQQSPTGQLTRPLVLLLAYGFQRPLMDDMQIAPAAGVTSFRRESFIPLRQRLARKLAWAGAGLSAAAVFVIVLLIS